MSVDNFTQRRGQKQALHDGENVVSVLERLQLRTTANLNLKHMATTQHTAQLNFLQEKIQQIGSALFFNLSDSVLKLPTSLVDTLKVDDFGFVWLTMKRPKQQVKEFESEFPVQLDYYKKGIGSYLQVCGKGWTVTDPEEMGLLQLSADQVRSFTAQQDTMLVKVKILKAEFYDAKSHRRQSWWQTLMNNLTAWFRNNQYRSNIYYPAAS